jgi:hypothetical protein
MASNAVPALLEALFIYDKASKANLRLCNKHFKILVDATVTTLTLADHDDEIYDDYENTVCTEWHGLKELYILDIYTLMYLPRSVFDKLSQLEALSICRSAFVQGFQYTLSDWLGDLPHLK